MDSLAKLLHEIYKDAYLQGRADGLEGLHIEPHLVLSRYLTNEQVSSKLSELGYQDTEAFPIQVASLH